LSTYLFCTNGSYFAGERDVPTIGYGPGSPLQAHVDDEYVPIAQLADAVDGYRAIIISMLSP
jgi:acetylornithine deacetylase/succinyl-diaminopimelate desuccinylase-like protein